MTDSTIANMIQMKAIHARLTCQNTRLSSANLKLLKRKRERLRESHCQLNRFITGLSTNDEELKSAITEAAQSTFVFAQEEAGTAVCISAAGLLLTCSHCVADSAREAKGKTMWLISAPGIVVEASCTAWDGIRDLALLQIIAAEGNLEKWPHAQLTTALPKLDTQLICIGHPGSEDFEHEVPGRATGYDVLHISEGRYRGCATGQDVQDNSQIGALKHNCWTYWGHSGAPLIERSTGRLIGLHSSWDDRTGMRHGIALEAVRAFLQEHDIDNVDDTSSDSAGTSVANAIVLE